MTLRARQTPSGCEIFSAVGPRYSPLDIDVIATQVHQVVPKDARAEVMYDGYRARISVLFQEVRWRGASALSSEAAEPPMAGLPAGLGHYVPNDV